jgi:transposase
MPTPPTRPPDAKTTALRRAGALHPRPDAIRDEAFAQHPFFDPRDRVQVRYEMVRRHRVDGRPVTEVAETFSVSRQAFYEAATAFEGQGIPGLLPKRPGPKRAHKCTNEILDFVEQWYAGDDVRPGETVSLAVARRFHVTIHPRSLDRAIARRKKKRSAAG